MDFTDFIEYGFISYLFILSSFYQSVELVFHFQEKKRHYDYGDLHFKSKEFVIQIIYFEIYWLSDSNSIYQTYFNLPGCFTLEYQLSMESLKIRLFVQHFVTRSIYFNPCLDKVAFSAFSLNYKSDLNLHCEHVIVRFLII